VGYTSPDMGDEDPEDRKDAAWITLCHAEGWVCRVCGGLYPNAANDSPTISVTTAARSFGTSSRTDH
jgi:hypothetical protein